MKRFRWQAIAACFLAYATTAVAAPSPAQRTIDEWRQLTEADVEAAYQLLLENHPGSVTSLGDVKFREALENGYTLALERATKVDSYLGYTAVLAGFATSFGDEHIWTNTKLRGIQYRWAGLVTARRGNSWIVAGQERQPDEPDLVGARLVSCGGEEASSFADNSLAFRISARIEAQYVAHGGFMLVDDGNPFVSRPSECVFEKDGLSTSMELNWRLVATPTLAESLQAAVKTDAAGFGIRLVGDTAWVAMERLSPEAQPVLDDFLKRRKELLGSRAIVVDLRGNGGGNSRYGRDLARLIYGDSFVAAKVRDDSICGAVWRASAGNAEHLRQIAASASNADSAKYYRELADRMEAAIEAGEAFESPLPDCGDDVPDTGPASADEPMPEYTGRVILLTDYVCFSSCLLMTQDFRRLGALHVGSETNAATRYMEVREIDLPSGLSTFSTLQKVQLGGAQDIGPFTPHKIAPNGTGNTGDLERWISNLD